MVLEKNDNNDEYCFLVVCDMVHDYGVCVVVAYSVVHKDCSNSSRTDGACGQKQYCYVQSTLGRPILPIQVHHLETLATHSYDFGKDVICH